MGHLVGMKSLSFLDYIDVGSSREIQHHKSLDRKDAG